MLTVQLVSTVLYLSIANFKVGVSNGLFHYNLEIRFSEFMADYAIRNGHLKLEFQPGEARRLLVQNSISLPQLSIV